MLAEVAVEELIATRDRRLIHQVYTVALQFRKDLLAKGLTE